jgi:hypothetical protein
MQLEGHHGQEIRSVERIFRPSATIATAEGYDAQPSQHGAYQQEDEKIRQDRHFDVPFRKVRFAKVKNDHGRRRVSAASFRVHVGAAPRFTGRMNG